MVNVFGESVASGGSVDLQLVKKVVTTVGTFGDYIDEIQQIYGLGFTPYRLHTNDVGTYVTPIRVYDGIVYVLDEVATMEVIERLQQMIKVNGSILLSLMMAVVLLCKVIEDPLELGV